MSVELHNYVNVTYHTIAVDNKIDVELCRRKNVIHRRLLMQTFSFFCLDSFKMSINVPRADSL